MPPEERILVHACCAGCSAYVLDLLSGRFEVTAFYYNPNIRPEEEYRLRLEEMRKTCLMLDIPLIEGEYSTGAWDERAEPFIDLPEKSERCWACYALRLEQTARTASGLGIGIFTTTLSVSPHKVYPRIVLEGERAARLYSVEFHAEDFKKRDGFRISVERSRDLGLHRQDYCGCIPSLEDSLRRKSGRGSRP